MFINDKGKTCKTTIDGVDCLICNKKPRSKKWYSHKFNGPALRYEVCVCIQTGDIVWINGPHKPGEMNDISIFRSKLRSMLLPGEKVEADLGYRGDLSKIRHCGVFISRSDRRAKKRVRARHETINNRLKKFNSLHHKFRHRVHKHKLVFKAVATIVQVAFDIGEKPFQCRY